MSEPLKAALRRLDMRPPVAFDKAAGDYPVFARPGITKIL